MNGGIVRRVGLTVAVAGGALAFMIAAITSASAAVTFDPATGTGFVGKGDVQTALGYNNAQLQQNANDLSFAYTATDTYSATCEWITGEGTKGEKRHEVTHSRSTSVDSTVAYDARKQAQVTGFNLTGFGPDPTESGEVPVLGGPCPGNSGHAGIWVDVELTGSEAALTVNGVPLARF